MKKQLLEEINRMKVLGNMINEAASPSSILAQLVSKFTKTALDDSILAAFEVLERKGVISIDKISKTLTKVDWQKLADDEMKLLFSAPPLRAALEEVTKKAGMDITSSATKASLTGGFRKIVKGYDDAVGNLISGAGSKTSSSAATSWKTRLSNILSAKKTATGTRYAPTPEDFLDVENLVIAANPGISGRKVSEIVRETKRIVSAKTQDEFFELAEPIIISMSNKLGKPKEWITTKLWRLIRDNPKTSIASLIIFAPTITAAVGNKGLDQFNTFLREFSPKFSGMLDKIGVSDPRTNSSNTNTNTNSGKGSQQDFTNFLINDGGLTQAQIDGLTIKDLGNGKFVVNGKTFVYNNGTFILQ